MLPDGNNVASTSGIQRLQEAELLDDQPLYVNAKPYHRILKRRQQRAKLEAQGKIPKERRVKLQQLLVSFGGSSCFLTRMLLNLMCSSRAPDDEWLQASH